MLNSEHSGSFTLSQREKSHTALTHIGI